LGEGGCSSGETAEGEHGRDRLKCGVR
jgi:hypothetical protein